MQTQPATSKQATPRSKASRIGSDSWQRNWAARPEADQVKQAQPAAGKTTKQKRSRDQVPAQTALSVFHAAPLRILLHTSILQTFAKAFSPLLASSLKFLIYMRTQLRPACCYSHCSVVLDVMLNTECLQACGRLGNVGGREGEEAGKVGRRKLVDTIGC